MVKSDPVGALDVVEDPEPVVVVPVVVVLVPVEPVVEVDVLELVFSKLAAAVRSISAPAPKTMPAKFVAVVLVPKASVSETDTVQSEFTL